METGIYNTHSYTDVDVAPDPLHPMCHKSPVKWIPITNATGRYMKKLHGEQTMSTPTTAITTLVHGDDDHGNNGYKSVIGMAREH